MVTRCYTQKKTYCIILYTVQKMTKHSIVVEVGKAVLAGEEGDTAMGKISLLIWVHD